MWQIFTGSLVLSLIHAAIPNHWLPLIAVGKAEKWTMSEVLLATVITSFAHTLSTIFIGIIVGLIGMKLSGSYNLISDYAAPSILIVIGAIYIISDLSNRGGHSHDKPDGAINQGSKKSKFGILLSLSIAMFITPCVEIEAYYFQGAMVGWKGIFLVSAVYTSTTLLIMLLFVWAGFKGTQRWRSHTLEHDEKLVTGIVLVCLGIFALFVRI